MTTPSHEVDVKPKQVAHHQPLVIVAVAVCAGIVADRYAALPGGLWWGAGLAAWIAWLVLRRRRWDRLSAAVLLVAVAAWGGAWHHCRWSLFARDDVGFFARAEDQPICVEAVALSGARRQPVPKPNPMRAMPVGDRTRVELAVVAVRDGAQWQEASGRARLMLDGLLSGVHAGDRLRVFAQLRALRPPRNPGEFDFAGHARADRSRGVLRAEVPDCVSVVAPAGLGSLRWWLDQVRTAGDRLLWEHVHPDRSGLAAALLLGIREEVTAEQTEAFMETGTIHVLSISGLHVGLLAGAMFLVVRMLMVPRRPAAVLVAAVTVFYTLLTDAEPPAVRAMILVLVVCGGYALGRRPLAVNSLAAAALVVLAVNPADLFRVGVQLSFLCVLGLSWCNASLLRASGSEAALRRLVIASLPWPLRFLRHAARWLWHLTLLGAVIWLLTLPLVMARFHLLSPVALVLNTLLWLPILLVLWSGFGVLAFGTIVPPMAAGFGWCCDKTLELLEYGIQAARGCPGSYFWVSGPADWWLAGFYGGLGLWAAFPRIRPPRRWCLALAAGWTAFGLAPGLLQGVSPAESPRLECTFLAVDHGCAVVLRLPSGATVLYDAGKFASPEGGTQSIAGALWAMGIRHLDAVVISHPDTDHYNALPGLLERRFSVGVIYVSPIMFDREGPGLAALREAIERAGIAVRPVRAGDRLQGGKDCRIEVLHPIRRGVPGRDNANSVVLAVEYLGRRILLPGDLERPGLAYLLAEEPWPCDVLLAPHHGSAASDPPGLAQWCRPWWVVISGGSPLDLHETLNAYHSIGATIVHTGRVGAVRAVIDASGLRLEPLCGGHRDGDGTNRSGE